MMARRWILIGVLGFTALVPGADARSETREESFLRGNRLYEAGDFAGAAEAYAAIREQGWTSAELEYNLGNAYLKAGSVGRAIVHFRRALILRPGYANASDNIKYAQ